MYNQIKNNLVLYITILMWVVMAILIIVLMKKQLDNTKPKQIIPEETLELNSSQVDTAVEFTQSISLTATSSSVTLESSESAQDK